MSKVIHKFTKTVPEWRPRVTPVRLDEATGDQLDALKVTPSNTKVSDYVLVLAHDVETLKVRSPLFNAIMYDRGGLSRAEREVGAVAASIINKCVYCAAVHASRHIQLEKSDELMDVIFAAGEFARLDPRNQAIFNFALRLAKSPSDATEADMNMLRDAGLSDEEIIDLILSSALFGWANRLMHVLGDPVQREKEAPS
ncbi:peroxidase-related enzyme [Aliiroseovarius sp. YM-037]|uniref:peroxidase-related enzyme n=1 Tax=Aliiroseovarius sp. YM-037 TaxID=3341728 RepID=UPI003A80F077